MDTMYSAVLKIVTLALFAAVAHAQGCQQVAQYSLYANQATNGGTCFDTTFDACLSRCNNVTRCTAFDWHAPIRCCVFESGSPQNLGPWQGLCTYIKIGPLDIPNERYFSREGWGAGPTRCVFNPQSPTRITIHHTAGNAISTSAGGINEMRGIQNYHQNGNGWCDIGYHFLVDLAGNIYQGRPFNSATGWPQPGSVPPTFILGAHAGGANTNNIGISVMGNFPSNAVMTRGDTAYNTVTLLAAHIARAYGISIDSISLRGHQDWTATTCPGQIYSLLPAFRQDVAAMLAKDIFFFDVVKS